MPKLRLSDTLGLNVDGKLMEGANLRSILPQFARLQDLTLDQAQVTQASMGLEFSQPLPVSEELALSVGASGGGRLLVLGPRQRAVDEDDPFNAITIAEGEMYVGLLLDFALTAGADASLAQFSFGLATDETFEVRCYRRFAKGAGGFPTFAKALGEVLDSFVLPVKAADLDDIPADAVLVVGGSGSLTAFGGFSFATPVQSLASASLIADTKLNVNVGGSASVDASITLSGGYQVRLRRSGPRKVEYGIYSFRSRERELAVTAKVGVSAAVGGFDVAEQLIRALSFQPVVDLAEFREALPGEDNAAKERRIARFDASLKAAVATKLQVSVRAAFSRLRSDDAAWLFEIDLDASAAASTQGAITDSLGGDFRALTADPLNLPDGVTQTANFLSSTEVRKQTLQVNVLGILNILSLVKVSQISSVELNAQGEITLITDTASANRLHAVLLNAAGNSRRLRKLLSEDFLIEAAYQVADLRVLPPGFESRHVSLEIHERTSRAEMKDNLDVARVLGLMPPEEVQRRLGDRSAFGRTTFYAELRYTHDAVRRLFFDDERRPRPVTEYETAGRSALGALIAGDEGTGFRARYADLGAAGTRIWDEMKRQGPPSFGPIFGLPKDTDDPRVGVAVADFIVITDWAKAMHTAALAIQEVDGILAGVGAAPDDAALTAGRERLKQRLAGVVRETKEQFGDPLGMMMVYIASNQDAAKTVRATGPGIEPLDMSAGGRQAAHA